MKNVIKNINNKKSKNKLEELIIQISNYQYHIISNFYNYNIIKFFFRNKLYLIYSLLKLCIENKKWLKNLFFINIKIK